MISLVKLADMARDSSLTGRTSLVSALTDLFLASKEDKAEQISLMFGDIVLKVLWQLEEEARMTLSKRVCRETEAPHDLMKQLAQDKISVAEPVLEHSPVLTADDLAEIASLGSMAHLAAIAGRETVEEKVTAILVDRGNADVLNKVAENAGARFDPNDLIRLIEKTQTDPGLQEALINRNDLTHDAAYALIPLLTDELKARVEELGADSTLVQVMAERAAHEVAARTRKLEEAREQSNSLIQDVLDGKKKIDEAVQMFARSDRAAELGILLAKSSELPAAAISQLVFGKSDKPLVILCRAAGVSDEAYKDILTMRARRLRLGGLELNAAIQRYSSMSTQAARRSLETLKQSGEAFGLKLPSKKQQQPVKKRDVAFAVRHKG